MEALLPYDVVSLGLAQFAARDPEHWGKLPIPGIDGMPTLNHHPVLCRDGRWIQLGNLFEHLFVAFLDAIDLLEELMSDERFRRAPAT